VPTRSPDLLAMRRAARPEPPWLLTAFDENVPRRTEKSTDSVDDVLAGRQWRSSGRISRRRSFAPSWIRPSISSLRSVAGEVVVWPHGSVKPRKHERVARWWQAAG
jgi:hypothetical protein